MRKSIFDTRWRQVIKVPADEAVLVTIAPDLAMTEGVHSIHPLCTNASLLPNSYTSSILPRAALIVAPEHCSIV